MVLPLLKPRQQDLILLQEAPLAVLGMDLGLSQMALVLLLALLKTALKSKDRPPKVPVLKRVFTLVQAGIQA